MIVHILLITLVITIRFLRRLRHLILVIPFLLLPTVIIIIIIGIGIRYSTIIIIVVKLPLESRAHNPRRRPKSPAARV